MKMLESDKKEFASIISATLKTYRVEPDADVLRLWWGVLSLYSIEQVRNGLNRFVSNKENKYSVVPAHIVEAIVQNNPDGRLGADEAWATYPRNEADSAVITDEMAEAMQVAYPLLQEGDKIGARMSFKEAYNRITEQNKTNNILPKWFPSLGHSKDGRQQVLEQAVKLGRITQDHALSLLPAPNNEDFTNAVLKIKSTLAIANNEKITDEDRAKAKEEMAKLRASVFKENE